MVNVFGRQREIGVLHVISNEILQNALVLKLHYCRSKNI